jgi:RimJ/RimL family protein N-acetyltransferase
VTLVTERLELRSFTAEDVDAMHRLYEDAAVMRFVGHGPLRRRSETESMLRRYIEHERRHGFSFWAVVERESGEVVGDAGLFSTGPGAVEVGYTLAQDRWGRGYGTEAARACVDAAFDRFGFDEVVAVIDPGNDASKHVVEKLGMSPAGSRIAFGRKHALYRLRREDRGEHSP